ncbi:DNA-3-methyladenine glycosylase [Alkalicoccus luteus]|uniref:DNA-3-methyladenine glycosylase II n=1 Tax=Alkalicoccus luteus TaxID=1237094 RepID=A0A969PTZ1_9BACI|nr:DNA-3-methyladenine glycosylase 2 family protein [Alkalicoccus luteus]
MATTTVKLSKPYRFDQALKRLSIDPLLRIDHTHQELFVPLWIDQKPVPVRLQQTGSSDKPVFQLEWEQADGKAVAAEIARLFQWNTDLDAVADSFKKTELDPLFQEFRHTPFVCDFQTYGSLMKTIIHQQLNMTFAFTLSTRFVHEVGFEKSGVWFYPYPETTASLEVADLRQLQFSGRKAEYVIDTSKLIANGTLSLDQLARTNTEEAIAALKAVRGIGRWTAENFLMFGLGELDLFPVQDIGIQNGWKKLHDMDRKPTADELDEVAKAWPPYRTYAALYLWESIESPPS